MCQRTLLLLDLGTCGFSKLTLKVPVTLAADDTLLLLLSFFFVLFFCLRRES